MAMGIDLMITTNRDRLLRTNEYDLLLSAQKILDKHHIPFCVLQLIGESDIRDRCIGLCELCIERWLNEKSK